MSNNPLLDFAKLPECFVSLSTTDAIPYTDNVLSEPFKKEVGVSGKSSEDEVMLNNPEALVNGQAIKFVIENNVKDVKDANQLFVPDVEILLLAISKASGEETYDISVTCPECGDKGEYQRNIDYLLKTTKTLDEEVVYSLSSGVILYFKPLTWEQYSKHSLNAIASEKEFQFRKEQVVEKSKNHNNDDTNKELGDIIDSDAVKLYSDFITNEAERHFGIMCDMIYKAELPMTDEMSDPIVVTDKSQILEFVKKLPKNDVKGITESIGIFDDIGVSHTVELQCAHCEHEWDIQNVRFNPTDFFGKGF